MLALSTLGAVVVDGGDAGVAQLDMEMDYAGVVVARSVAGVAQLARASSGSVVQL